jgi:hypothetical protein
MLIAVSLLRIVIAFRLIGACQKHLIEIHRNDVDLPQGAAGARL